MRTLILPEKVEQKGQRLPRLQRVCVAPRTRLILLGAVEPFL